MELYLQWHRGVVLRWYEGALDWKVWWSHRVKGILENSSDTMYCNDTKHHWKKSLKELHFSMMQLNHTLKSYQFHIQTKERSSVFRIIVFFACIYLPLPLTILHLWKDFILCAKVCQKLFDIIITTTKKQNLLLHAEKIRDSIWN